MKKFYLLLLCCIAAVSCTKTDDPNANPLVFEKSELNLAQYTQTQMVALANKPEGATITYQSSNNGVATIDANGMIEALAVGQTFISAYVDGDRDATLSNTLTVNVTANVAKGIVLNYPDKQTTVTVNDTIKASYTFDPATTSDRKVTVVTSDSVGTKYLTFEVKEAAEPNKPNALNIVAINAGTVTFYLEQTIGKEKLKSKSVTIVVEPATPAGTGLAISLTPTQLRKGLEAPSQMQVGATERLGLDTIAIDFLPDNFSAKPLKIAFDEQGIVFATDITFKDKIGDKKVIRRGVVVTPIKEGYVGILITSTDGYQISHNISVKAADPVAAKYAAIKSIKFKKRNIDLPTIFYTNSETATLIPEIDVTFKEADVSPEDAKFTKALLQTTLDNNYAPKKDTLLSTILTGTLEEGEPVMWAKIGLSGHGYARLFAKFTDPDGKVFVDTCMVKVTGLPEGMVFKPTFDFADAKYTVNALINPVDYSYGGLQSGVKAYLIYTKPVGEKEKPVDPVVKETITLSLSDKGSYYIGSFASFADGARLAGYSVKYEFEIRSGNAKAKYFYETKNIEVNTGTAFAPKR